MGMSLCIFGIKPKDEKWNQMMNAYNACVNASVPVPKDVMVFFDYRNPNEMDGLEIDMDNHKSVQKYNDDSQSGFTIEIGKLPKDIKYIRVVNSW